MMKPRLIYNPENPSAFKNKNKNLPPVHWMYNPRPALPKVYLWIGSTNSSSLKPKNTSETYASGSRHYLLLLILVVPLCIWITKESKSSSSLLIPPPSSRLWIKAWSGAFKTLCTCNSLEHLVYRMDSDEKFKLRNSGVTLRSQHAYQSSILLLTTRWKKPSTHAGRRFG